jgi:TonB family protein
MIGTTRFLAMVDATGKPTHCEIVDSSGFDVLDAATCRLIMERARFSPARTPTGKQLRAITVTAFAGRFRRWARLW